jgi:hypothetical protein
VALQWPNPRILCYTTSYSDIPSGSRPVGSTGTPSSLYRLNLGFNYLWLILLVVMAVARDVQLVIMCVTFQVAHVAVVLLFR